MWIAREESESEGKEPGHGRRPALSIPRYGQGTEENRLTFDELSEDLLGFITMYLLDLKT
jgi:hypothetical protein